MSESILNRTSAIIIVKCFMMIKMNLKCWIISSWFLNLIMFLHGNFVLQNAKYNSSKGGYSSSTTSDSRYEGRMRDSPNGNSYSPAGGLGMGMGADRDSPRNYASKPLYKKERENRDYKLSSSRDKYSGEIFIFPCLFYAEYGEMLSFLKNF